MLGAHINVISKTSGKAIAYKICCRMTEASFHRNDAWTKQQAGSFATARWFKSTQEKAACKGCYVIFILKEISTLGLLLFSAVEQAVTAHMYKIYKQIFIYE